MTAPTKYSKLVEKLIWLTIPLMISLLTYLVVSTFTVKEEVAKVAVAHQSDVAMDGKMWELVNENNKILHSKADQESNEKEHQMLLNKLDRLEVIVDKVYRQRRVYGMDSKIKIDTMYYMPTKDMSFVSTENKNN